MSSCRSGSPDVTRSADSTDQPPANTESRRKSVRSHSVSSLTLQSTVAFNVCWRLGAVRLKVVPAGFWARWDRARLERSGGTLEQYKHPCLISDMGFYRQVRSQVVAC